MEVITELDFQLKNSSVSLGKFDGIHKGHRCLLENIQKRKDLVPTVFTFDIRDTKKIYTQKEKNDILENLGVEKEIVFPFREETKKMSAEDFILKILLEKMDVKYICVGEDFRFGKDRSGDVHTLRQYGEKYGYQTEIVKKLTCAGETISSTRVRKFLEEGEVEKAGTFLGENYFITGQVLSGEALGRTLKSPTANLLVEKDKFLPRFGVYATISEIDGREVAGVTNVGVKPTAGTFPVGVETNLFNFHEDIYGKRMRVRFCSFLREERKFASFDALKKQIEVDKQQAEAYFLNRRND